MNNLAVNNETIVKYLLGSLPEAETERLDELSITDDEFAVALSAAEKDLVDAYVQGELTGTALESFRSYYLASPLRRGRLDFARALDAQAERHYTAQSATTPDEFPAKRPTTKKRSGWFAGKGLFTTPRLLWQWGFAAAAIAFLVAGSWLLSENTRLRQQIARTQARPEGPGTREQELQNELERQRQAVATTEQELARVTEERERLEAEIRQRAQGSQVANAERNAPNQQRPSPGGLSIASFILMPQMRGVQQVPTISIPANTDQVSMKLELEPNDFRAYRVSLVAQAGTPTIWRSRQLNATATAGGKALNVTFPASLLKPQVYVLRVTGVAKDASSEAVSDYPFKVVKQ
jgi:hypothetical protein